jgi:hypothetical protein
MTEIGSHVTCVTISDPEGILAAQHVSDERQEHAGSNVARVSREIFVTLTCVEVTDRYSLGQLLVGNLGESTQPPGGFLDEEEM